MSACGTCSNDAPPAAPSRGGRDGRPGVRLVPGPRPGAGPPDRPRGERGAAVVGRTGGRGTSGSRASSRSSPASRSRMAAVRETIVHLMGMGRFIDVQVSAFEDGDRVRVAFDLVPLRQSRQIVFAGELGLPEDTLRAFVANRFGPSPPHSRAADIARALEELLADHGFLRAKVERPEREAAPADGDLVFRVLSGVRAVVRTVSYRADDPEDALDMEARVPLRTGSFLDRAGMRRRLDDAVERWRARGYYEARADAAVEESAAGDAVDVTITFVRGPKVTVSVRDNALTAKQLAEFVPVAREGSVDEDLLEDSEARIEESLRAQGYRDADAVIRAAGRRRPAANRVHRQVRAALPRGRRAVRGGGGGEARRTRRTDEPGRGPAVRAGASRRRSCARCSPNTGGAGSATRPSGRRSSPCRARGPSREAPVVVTSADRRRAAHHRHGRGHGGQPRTVARRAGGRTGHPRRRAAVRSGRRGRSRSHPRPVSQPGLPARARRRLRRPVGRPNGRARPVRDRRGAAGAGGPHPRRRQRAGRRSDDQARTAAQARRAARPRRRSRRASAGWPPWACSAASRSPSCSTRADNRRDVLVTVEESPATTLGYGGGVEFQEVETVEFAPRGFFEIGRRNLWGKNRVDQPVQPHQPPAPLLHRGRRRRAEETASSSTTSSTASSARTASRSSPARPPTCRWPSGSSRGAAPASVSAPRPRA